MKNTLRLSLLATVIVLATVLAMQAAAARSHGDAVAFEATFKETNESITNRIADLGVFQLINRGTGNVHGLGDASIMLSATQDRTVQPCGPGSWTNAAVRRIVLPGGVLILRELVYICQSSSGPVGTGTWIADGASSNGIFAGARGVGKVTIVLATGTATLSGGLTLNH